MNDLMRLPLGILTGVGFIGAGAIIRRHNIVIGVTTAATLWFATVVGLCFGGGQIDLGATAPAIGLFVLWSLNWVESRLRQESRASLHIDLEGASPSEGEIRHMLENAGLRIAKTQITLADAGRYRELMFEIIEYRLPYAAENPPVIATIAAQEGVVRVEWKRL
jgi:putative Mg2+ transporter-C (MgtC) family protein